MKADPTTAKFLPYSRQSIDEDDIAAVVAALRSDFLTTGPLVDQFEFAFAEAAGADNPIVCNSGTSALHLALLALKVGPGDHVIVPAVTFLSTANVARMAGAEVIFADVDPDTGLMTPETFEAAITTAADRGQHVAAALPVHLGGQLCDMAAFGEIAARHGISLVEDACHALGVPGIGATQHSAMAVSSTHPVKAIATGEGGAVATSNSDLAMRLRQLRSHGMSRNPDDGDYPEQGLDQGIPNPWYYEMAEIGWNYRLPDVLCALGLSQLKKLDGFITRRQEIAARYDALLMPLAPDIAPVPRGTGPHSAGTSTQFLCTSMRSTRRAARSCVD